jgi:hypothetical protein
MGLRIHYEFTAYGSTRDIWYTLDHVRRRAKSMPVKAVGPLTLIRLDEPVGDGGYARTDLCWHLAEHLLIHYKVREFPRSAQSALQHAIVASGHGMGFLVDLERRYSPMSIFVARLTRVPIWNGSGFVKTDCTRAWERIHNLVLDLLEVCADSGILLSVSDEAMRWEERRRKVGDAHEERTEQHATAISPRTRRSEWAHPLP